MINVVDGTNSPKNRCNRCDKDFTQPWQLKRHRARKTPCAPILEEEDLSQESLEDPDLDKKKCRFCGRIFTSYTNMRRHVRNTCKIAPNERNGDSGMELLYRHTIQKQQKQIGEQQEQIEALTAMMQQLVPAQAGTGSTTTTTNSTQGEVAINAPGDHNEVKVDNSKNITINVFGQEQLGHITQEQIRQILSQVSTYAIPEAATQAVLQAAMLAYSDPEHPENLTCYLPNKKLNDALIHGGNGWEVQSIRSVLPPMVSKSVDVLFDNQPREGADVMTFAEVLKALQECEKDPAAMKQLAGPSGALRTVLMRNKELLTRILEELPVAGQD